MKEKWNYFCTQLHNLQDCVGDSPLHAYLIWYIIKIVNGKQVIAILKEAGWELIRVEGSHYQMGKDGQRTSVPIHGTKDLKPGTLAGIRRQTGVKLK